jgi:hypothetical protein
MARIDAGKIAEYQCATELLKRGITPSWPSVETEPFDIIASVGQRFARLQVKSSGQARPALRLATKTDGLQEAYTKEHIDYIILWAVKADEWFIIPVEEITTKNIYINTKSKKCPWNKYKNAWHLIKGEDEAS